MAVLVAVLHVFTRLAGDNEITALQAGGVSVTRLVAPVLAGATGVALLSFLWNDQLLPRTNHELRTLQVTSHARSRADAQGAGDQRGRAGADLPARLAHRRQYEQAEGRDALRPERRRAPAHRHGGQRRMAYASGGRICSSRSRTETSRRSIARTRRSSTAPSFAPTACGYRAWETFSPRRSTTPTRATARCRRAKCAWPPRGPARRQSGGGRRAAGDRERSAPAGGARTRWATAGAVRG